MEPLDDRFIRPLEKEVTVSRESAWVQCQVIPHLLSDAFTRLAAQGVTWTWCIWVSSNHMTKPYLMFMEIQQDDMN